MKKDKKVEVLRKTYKAKIRLSEEAKTIFEEVSSIMVLLWNIAHAQILEWWADNQDKPKEERKVINAFALNYWLTDIRAEYPEINRVSSDVCQQVLKILMGGFESFWALKRKKDSKAKIPKRKGTDEKPFEWFQTLGWQTLKIAKDGKSIFLPSLDKRRIEILLPEYLQQMIKDKVVKYATMYKSQDGDFWLSLVCVSGLPEQRKNGIIRAIDLGAGCIAMSDSDGAEFLIPTRREDKWVRQNVRHIESRTKIRVKGSRGYKKLMGARRHLFERVQNQHTDHQRKIASAICEEKVQCLVIGKPKTRIGLAQAGTNDQNWGVQNTGYMGRLMIFLREKALERGIQVIEFEDPKRIGELDLPDNKFLASREILKKVLVELGREFPEKFEKRGFSFP